MKPRPRLMRKSRDRAMSAKQRALAAERLAAGAHRDHILAALEMSRKAAPVGPNTPVACASSTMQEASWRGQRRQAHPSGAVAVHAVEAFHRDPGRGPCRRRRASADRVREGLQIIVPDAARASPSRAACPHGCWHGSVRHGQMRSPRCGKCRKQSAVGGIAARKNNVLPDPKKRAASSSSISCSG